MCFLIKNQIEIKEYVVRSDLVSETWKTVDLDGPVFVVWAAQIYDCRLRFRTGNQVQFPASKLVPFSLFLLFSLHVTEIFGTGIRPRFPSRFLVQFSCFGQMFLVIYRIFLDVVADQVEACWQWHNYLVNACPVGKTTLTINIDETYVNFFQGIYKGNLAVATQDLPPDAPPLMQHATRSQLRSGLTHVGVICDVPVVQPLLPQILIAPKNVLTVRDLAGVRAAMPEPIYVVHKKSKWANVKILVWLMQMIHWSLRHVRSLYNVVIMLDVLVVHFTPELLQCMDTLSFKYMYVPARLTWLIQPCDTHCFALYKRFLKLRVLRYRARNPFSTVPAVPVWFRFIADTIVNLMNQRSWVTAFRENGVVSSSFCCAVFLQST